MARRDQVALLARRIINNPGLAAAVQANREARALLPPRAKDGPAGRIAHERALAAVKQAEAETLSVAPADSE